jgi:tRNA(fMet)-specific endonuclease VapC
MGYLLDTNTISYYLRRVPEVLKKFDAHPFDDMYISTLVTMEIEYGFSLNAKTREEFGTSFERLLDETEIISFTATDALIAGKIRAELQRKGQSIGDIDEMLAGTAIAQDLILVTSNTDHFNRIPGLKFEDWKTP